ncbi:MULTISPECIES: flavodoxin family protein [unclassified Ornithinimicrobium]|uniref:flavodoxin family protein n=1 Tax=unclassified Ornithinimicrobium TaxID=2615080 RepID=UPI00385317B8
MTYLVVYESAFGNTREVAEAVAAGLGEGTEAVDVGTAPPLEGLDVDLLVLGGPTHAFGMSRPQTREDAEARGGHPPSTGIREWLDAAEGASLRVATFDTHTRKPNLPGTAGKAAAKRLRALGCTLVADPEKFWVHGDRGPLLDGELERATTWGERLRETRASAG